MTHTHDKKTCPRCGEDVKKTWKLCPACETPLTLLQCPKCKAPVKEHWKRCPECETALLCTLCGNRIPPGSIQCPQCHSGTSEPGDQRRRIEEPVTGMLFMPVPAGIFTMGDTFGDGFENELPVHEVRLNSFYMGAFPVTQGQWKCVMRNNPSKFQDDSHPVEQVSWYDVQEFIEKLTDGNESGFRFSMPSEAQWEYAARSGGKQELYAGGDDVNALAWYEENSGGTTRPVAARAPNGLGLFDMSGNVWEWCRDVFDRDAYKSHALREPVCKGTGDDRVIRGGGWNLDAWSVRCARRFSMRADFSAPALGCRLVLIPGTPSL